MQRAAGAAGRALARNLLKEWKCCDAFVISRSRVQLPPPAPVRSGISEAPSAADPVWCQLLVPNFSAAAARRAASRSIQPLLSCGMLRLGVPMGLSYAVKATSFTFITVLVARLGTNVMGGHQIVANLAALCFMVPLSLAVATATLTAHAIGAEDDAGRSAPPPRESGSR